MKKKEKYKVRTQILVQIGSRTWAMEVRTHTKFVHVMVTCLKRKWLWSFSLCKEDIFFLGYDDIHQQVMK